MFTLTQTVSTHKNQVNVFSSLEKVYAAYEHTVEGKTYRLLTTNPDTTKRAQAGLNEINTVLDFQETINPLVRELIKGISFKPEEQFNSFKQLFKEGPQTEISRLENVAQQVADWVGFRFVAQKDQLGLEFFTEWTHTGARVIDNLNAFFYAQHLATDISDTSWETFQKTTNYQKTVAFRQTIEAITKPVSSPELSSDQEGMAISTALQEFRRKSPTSLTNLLTEKGNQDIEKLLEEKLGSVKEKYEGMKTILDSFPSIEEAYRQLKAKQAPTMEEANNIRREIGGTGFLIALQQAFKTGFISKTFYVTHQQMISDLVKTCNEMDKCNFEINLGYGVYQGDAIPSPYSFFDK